MRKKDDCAIIKKTQKIRIDTMNRNTIISLSMLYALWQTERKDLLDLIRPFVMYAVGSVTAVGSQVNETEVCKAMEREFGYKTFQPAVIHRILSREAATTIEKDRRKIVKRSGHFFLVASLSALNEDFINKRTQCKAHTDAVTKALSEYLNKNNVYGRSDFSQEESERMLLSFFEQYGNSVILSVDDLRQIRAKDNENFYYIGKFILGENEKNTVLIDYIVELVSYLNELLSKRPEMSKAKREKVLVLKNLQQFEEATGLAKENYYLYSDNPYHIQAYFDCLINTYHNKPEDDLLLDLLEKLGRIRSEKAQSMYGTGRTSRTWNSI